MPEERKPEKRKPEAPTTNVVVTLSAEHDADVRRVSKDLKKLGFVQIEHLDLVNALLGTFEGDTAKLKAVKGVAAVEREGEMFTQG